MSFRPLRESEAEGAARRAAVAMGAAHDEEAVERWRGRAQQGVAWGLERDGAVVGHCTLRPTDHWFGGRRVTCLDIASVAVAPEWRGQGVARAMMEAAVRHGVAEGCGLSLLFPASTAMYRKLGWEHAGDWRRYRVVPRAVPADGPAMRLGDRDGDWAAIRACQERSVRRLSGPAVRGEARWAALAEAPYRYVLDVPDEPGTLEAYALIRQRPLPDDWRHAVVLDDWAATSARGLRAVVATVGRWSTFGGVAELVDTVPSRWAGLVPEQDMEHAGGMHWMARGLDLPAAVAARGFPSALDVSVTFAVEGTDAEPQPWRLEVAGGNGKLSPAPEGEVRLRARAVGPLFTGFRAPADLRLLGLLDGPDGALEPLGAAFAGSPPVVMDFF